MQSLIVSVVAAGGLAMFASSQAMAELSADVQAKVKTYQDKLAGWAKDPDIIDAINRMNTQKSSMDNASWKTLPETDPAVASHLSSSAAKKLSKWKHEEALGKLFIRDKSGNFVAGSNKPAIYNISDRPPFKNAINGKAWSAKKAKQDPTTKKSSVQLSFPVVSGGENIGIIHTAILLE